MSGDSGLIYIVSVSTVFYNMSYFVATKSIYKVQPCVSCFPCRPIWEGGEYSGDENSRFEALQLAMELGADHIDIELKVPFHLSFKL